VAGARLVASELAPKGARMPLLNELDFSRDALAVSYRASPDPQKVTIHFRTQRPLVIEDSIAVLVLTKMARLGMAGSDLFDPRAGHSPRPSPKVVKESRVAPGEYRLTLEMAAVAPIFMRIMVEHLRAVGKTVPLASLSILGELPTDATPMSATERDVKRWLDDAKAYPKRWPTISFPVEIEEPELRGLSVRMSFGGKTDKSVQNELESRLLAWRNMVVNYVSPTGGFVRQQLGPTVPTYAWKKGELSCGIELFEHTRGPSVDILLNMLERVHAEVVPLRHALVKA
jgi:hypothetical protein